MKSKGWGTAPSYRLQKPTLFCGRSGRVFERSEFATAPQNKVGFWK
jgi:hypothetical protein